MIRKYKIVIWGDMEQYDSFINQIKYEELKGNIIVEGIVSLEKHRESLDGYKILDKFHLKNMDIDCVLVTSTQFYFDSAKEEILSIVPWVEVISAKVFSIPMFDFKRYFELLKKKVTIVSNTCWGGLTYNSLYMEFYSPFINLTITPKDYIKLLKDFRKYIGEPLQIVKDRDCEGNPIGKLVDIEINFVHYSNFREAEKCWNRRIKRMNFENLFIYMPITDSEMAKEFSNLSFDKKYGFTNKEYNNHLYHIKEFENSGEAIRTFAERGFSSYMNDQARRRLYDYDDTLGNRGAKTIKAYNVLKLLNGEDDFFRT